MPFFFFQLKQAVDDMIVTWKNIFCSKLGQWGISYLQGKILSKKQMGVEPPNFLPQKRTRQTSYEDGKQIYFSALKAEHHHAVKATLAVVHARWRIYSYSFLSFLSIYTFPSRRLNNIHLALLFTFELFSFFIS